jgi:predicted secreted hydrolase
MAPHDVLTEWWYYTGQLWTDDGKRYGFQFVVFQSIRATSPVGYLAHFAVTDVDKQSFSYSTQTAQRRARPASLDLEVGGWSLRGADGKDTLAATMEHYALDLVLTQLKPAVLHSGGLISFGAAGDSYYYSHTRLAVSGMLRDGDSWHEVTGLAWHDHQWGDFIVAPLGGWDWFSIQLDDESDLMVTQLRGPTGDRLALFGSYVDQAGSVADLAANDLDVNALAAWISPDTSATYPSAWTITVRENEGQGVPALNLYVSPLVAEQELAFPHMSYWEGAIDTFGTADGRRVAGHGYVELTGYLPR